MDNSKQDKDSLKDALKKKIKDKIKKELIEEIYNELKLEEEELTGQIVSRVGDDLIKEHLKSKPVPTEFKVADEKITLTIPAILKIASHSLKYASEKIPRDQWVEVIGLLAGKIKDDGITLHVEDAYPMGHGNAIHAEVKDYKNYVRAFNDIKKKDLFICGWYHSHPSYGCFMSMEDIGTQNRYQKLWDKAIALVVDPYQINGTSFGFEIYRANLKTQKWYSVPFGIIGSLDVSILPELLNFINPIIEGKAIYLEYDEE